MKTLRKYICYKRHSNANHQNNQVRFKFPNNFGASIIRGKHSYGGSEGLYELAVIQFDANDDWKIHYNNPVAQGDVRGYLSESEVILLLHQIKNLDTLLDFKQDLLTE
jgi:hypothetical protein